MELIIAQSIVFVVMSFYGLLLGLFYAAYKKVKVNNGWVLNCLDFFVPLILGIAAFLLLLYTNRGEFRFFIIAAVVLGFVFSKHIFKMIKK